MIFAKKFSLDRSISIPIVFRYIGLKFIASIHAYNYRSDLASYFPIEHSWITPPMISIFQIYGDAGNYDMSIFKTANNIRYKKFNNNIYNSDWSILETSTREGVYRIFDNSTSTKCYTTMDACCIVNIWYKNGIQMESSGDETRQDLMPLINSYYNTTCRTDRSETSPVLIVFDLKDNPLNTSLYNHYSLYNGNDIASQTNVQTAVFEIIGSNDYKNWFRLDYFCRTDLSKTNYGLYYTGTFNVEIGDFYKYMDFTTWPNIFN